MHLARNNSRAEVNLYTMQSPRIKQDCVNRTIVYKQRYWNCIQIPVFY